ncbi:hypothetical protein D4R42_03600 [bacterium]|nr:MAG: hypothetical protein D4R42_03600 [bacterium]
MKSPHIKFVVDQRLDIENHLIGVQSYKAKLHSSHKKQNKRYEKLLKLSVRERRNFIKKEISDFYSSKNRSKLKEIKNDSQKYWDKIERKFFLRIKNVFGNPFPYNSIKGVFSTAGRFGYSIKDKWFATNINSNKFVVAETAMHELFHFVFHFYFWKECEKYKLNWKQIWNIKEATTVLLNSDFLDLRLKPDNGYPEHKKIRNFISKEWKKNKDFEKVLDKTCKFLANNKSGLAR